MKSTPPAEYFESVYSVVDKKENKEYNVYRTIGHPMVLFHGKTGEAIASLHFASDTASTFITKRPGGSAAAGAGGFLGVIGADKQKIHFVITNLLADRPIVIDILKGENRVNDINVLDPMYPITVKGDASAGQKVFILDTDAAAPAPGVSSGTVRQDEAQPGGPKGAYFTISVTPGKTSTFMDFSSAVWQCADFICIKSARPARQGGAARMGGFSFGAPASTRDEYDLVEFGASDSPSFSDGSPTYGAPAPAFGGGRGGGFVGGIHRIATSVNQTSFGQLQAFHSGPAPSSGWGSATAQGGFGGGRSSSGGFGGGAPVRGAGWCGTPSGGGSSDALIRIPQYEVESFQCAAMSLPDEEEDLGFEDTARAANIVHGSEVHKVQSRAVTDPFDYEHRAPTTTLCLSVICTGVDMLPPLSKSATTAAALALAADAISNESKNLLASLEKVHEAERECVICMDGPPNVIYFKCGHQCAHSECTSGLSTPLCPLCRATILATVSAGAHAPASSGLALASSK